MKNKQLSAVERAKLRIGKLTPLKGHDCGQLCSAACCKGDDCTGMLLFPGENSELKITELPDGDRLAVCDGHCNRDGRPLACMLFPFFPTVDDKGRVYPEIDLRACGVCPLAAHSEEIIFDSAFVKAVRKAGQELAKDEDCLAFMHRITAQIDELAQIHDLLLP